MTTANDRWVLAFCAVVDGAATCGRGEPARIEGVMTDDAIGGAEVIIEMARAGDGRPAPLRGVTSRDGRFQPRSTAVRAEYRVQITADGYLSARQSGAWPALGAVATVPVVELRPMPAGVGRLISCVVGAPLAGVEVAAAPGGAVSRTGLDGRFRFERLAEAIVALEHRWADQVERRR